jgi:hypothetical protein
MKRRTVDPKLIDHRDANAKELVWLVLEDGSKLLYGFKRLATEYRINLSTLHNRWRAVNKPDEIPLSMLTPAENSYNSRSEQPAVTDEKQEDPEPQQSGFEKFTGNKTAGGYRTRDFILIPDNTVHYASELDRMFDVPATTLNLLKSHGKTVFTREELEGMKRQDRTVFIEKKKVEPVATTRFPRNIDEVEYNPSPMERILSGLRC